MSAYAIIRQAIQQKHQILATYQDYRREMCPHVLGKKDGEDHALFYQFGGGSKHGLQPDGSPANWRCIKVDDLTNVTSRPGSWHTARDHSKKQTCVDQVDVEVRY